MAGEFQKDVKFNEIEVGDMILVELFGETGEYFGDRRGTAKERIGDIWYFDDMYPVYKDVAGYRMFKVTEIVAETTVPVAELERLRKIEEGVRKIIKDRTTLAETLRKEADDFFNLTGLKDTADHYRGNADRIMAEVWPLEALFDE